MSTDTDKLIAMQAQVDELARIASDAVREKNALAAALEAAEARLAREEGQHEATWVLTREYLARAEAAEAQRDTFAEALGEIERLSESPSWDDPVAGVGPIARAALAAVTPPEEGPPPGYVVPEGDERCGYVMDACQCMKRKGHDGLHGCAHGGWRSVAAVAPPGAET